MSAVLQPPLPAPPTPRWRNRFAALGPRFYTRLPAQPLPEPYWVATSDACAALLGWAPDWWRAPGALEAFSGGAPWPGMDPLAAVYSGHQFGVWAGQLGDGRALWLGEVESPAGPQELQLKGSGLTPYSRMGDGRAVLRSSIREFLCSEAMHALGVPTTRALCVTGSALPVRRETVETAAVVTRVAPSFIRFGHFEHFTHSAQDTAALRQLADFVIDAYYPGCRDTPEPVLALLREVSRRTAELIANWQAVGFCHGVMNTDNLSILGLTIDYGPFGFLDTFDPGHICNHSDHQGRYAYGRQPQVGWWNLHALAQGLAPLVDGNDADERLADAVEPFKSAFPRALQQRFRAKLGLATERDDDGALVDDLLRLMAADRCDFAITFRALSGAAARDHFVDRAAFDAWHERYRARLQAEGSIETERVARMHAANPKFVLRNHLAQTAIQRAQQGDFDEVARLQRVLSRPYDEQPEHAAYAAFPPDWAPHIEVSCSS
jgi:uncharacterized protein YdiU (UPF0061 family)